jgi:hypothetical protein
MRMLDAGIDITTIALWLGHESTESTQPYLHADLGMKQRALDRLTPLSAPTTRRYRPDDQLLSQTRKSCLSGQAAASGRSPDSSAVWVLITRRRARVGD